jgi:hypothetical protein
VMAFKLLQVAEATGAALTAPNLSPSYARACAICRSCATPAIPVRCGFEDGVQPEPQKKRKKAAA